MDELFRYFNIISKHANVYIDKVLEPFGLYSCHRVFIKKIIEHPGITRDKIKNMVHIHPSNTTRIIDFLEEKEYIIKKISEEDRRTMYYGLNLINENLNKLCKDYDFENKVINEKGE